MKRKIIAGLIIATMLSTTACSFGQQAESVDLKSLREELRAEMYDEVRAEAEAEIRESMQSEIDALVEERLAEEMANLNIGDQPEFEDDDIDEDSLETAVEEVIGDAATGSASEDNRESIEALVQREIDYYDEANSYSKTLDIFETDKLIISLNKHDYSDTKITFLGDSITYGIGSQETVNDKPKSYVYYVEEMLGCQTENLSVAGCSLGAYGGDTSIANYVQYIPDDTDIIVVMGGINDFLGYNSYYIDDNAEDGTYKGEVINVMEAIRNRFPDKPVYFITLYQNRAEDIATVTGKGLFSSYMGYQVTMAERYDINVIDMYGTGYLDNADDKSYGEFFFDLIHPNDNGYRLIGKHVAAQIIKDQWED